MTVPHSPVRTRSKVNAMAEGRHEEEFEEDSDESFVETAWKSPHVESKKEKEKARGGVGSRLDVAGVEASEDLNVVKEHLVELWRQLNEW
mgnify:CR=1 FL=1